MKLIKILKKNIPYLIFFYLGNIFSNHVRAYSGGDFIDRIMKAFSEVSTMSYLPSLHIYDLGIGVAIALIIKFIIYVRTKKRLKASVIILVHNYSKMRYVQAGNVRFNLDRDGFLKMESMESKDRLVKLIWKKLNKRGLSMEIFNIKKIYEDYDYPKEYLKILKLDLLDFDMWYLMSKEDVEFRINALKNRYPERKLIPFARRDDCDDIACFEIGKDNKVEIVHDYSSPGYEQRKEYDCFWDWFRDAVEEMIERHEDDE